VIKKIKSLRSQYSREKQKERVVNSDSESDGVFVSKWVHYQRLSFLDNHVTPRPRKTIPNYVVSLRMVSTMKQACCSGCEGGQGKGGRGEREGEGKGERRWRIDKCSNSKGLSTCYQFPVSCQCPE
jgi:hypothetical protein